MNILYLPGNSVVNKDEAYNIKTELELKGHNVTVQEWRHWSDENIQWNLDEEIKRIKSLNLNEIDVVIGKSIGSFVVCKLVSDYIIDPKRVILLGLPLDSALVNINDYSTCLDKMGTNFVVIQNNNDPYGPLNLVEDLIKDKSGVKLILKEASTHIYNYPEDILNALI